ncbi:hypothetical protein Hanom_Chr02g00140781 [Helianthus anomalus]
MRSSANPIVLLSNSLIVICHVFFPVYAYCFCKIPLAATILLIRIYIFRTR